MKVTIARRDNGSPAAGLSRGVAKKEGRKTASNYSTNARKANPAGGQAHGVHAADTSLIETQYITPTTLESIGCAQYFDGCACALCEAADRVRFALARGQCIDCGEPLAGTLDAGDGRCWVCAERRDLENDRAMYASLAHGLG